MTYQFIFIYFLLNILQNWHVLSQIYINFYKSNIIFTVGQPMGGNQSRLTEENRRKLDKGEPVLLGSGVKITKDPKTGKLIGVPEQWVKGYDLPMDIDHTRTVKTKHFSQQIKPQQDLPDSIIQFINQQPIHISKPTNFEHKLHLEVDLNSPMGIKGLTEDMLRLFKKNDLSGNEIKENPQAMIQIMRGLEQKEQIPDNALLSDAQFNKQVAKIQFKPENPNQAYRFAKQLGKGAMCTVYQAFNRKNTNECWAVRVMKVPEQDILHKIKIQAAVMSMCSNPNIVNYHASYYYMNCLFMFIEFMDGGCLTEVIYQNMKTIPQNLCSFIMREILLGLDALHKHKQIHRDLKSDNILVDRNGRIKVADFGFAIQLTKQQKNRKSVVGTPAWMAPELIKKENYNELVDVWSVGVIAVQLAEGQPPYLRLPALKAMYFISTKQAYRLNKMKFSEAYCDFVARCLEKDLKKRWSIKQLLNHQFITQIGQGIKEREQFATMVRNKKDVSLSQLMAKS